jgi:hypothetical protein
MPISGAVAKRIEVSASKSSASKLAAAKLAPAPPGQDAAFHRTLRRLEVRACARTAFLRKVRRRI